MKCQVCSGKMEVKKINHDVWVDRKLFVVKGVPAEVCERCGETVFTPQITDRILSTLKHAQNPQKTLKVPVLQLRPAV